MTIHASYSEKSEIEALYQSHIAHIVERFNICEAREIYDNYDFLCEILNATILERFHVCVSQYVDKSNTRSYLVTLYTYEQQCCDEFEIARLRKNIRQSVYCETATSALALVNLLLSIVIDIH